MGGLHQAIMGGSMRAAIDTHIQIFALSGLSADCYNTNLKGA
jgi:hypothetical protein